MLIIYIFFKFWNYTLIFTVDVLKICACRVCHLCSHLFWFCSSAFVHIECTNFKVINCHVFINLKIQKEKVPCTYYVTLRHFDTHKMIKIDKNSLKMNRNIMKMTKSSPKMRIFCAALWVWSIMCTTPKTLSQIMPNFYLLC